MRRSLPEEVIVAPQDAISVPQVHQGVNHCSIHTCSVKQRKRMLVTEFTQGEEKLVEKTQQKEAEESQIKAGSRDEIPGQ